MDALRVAFGLSQLRRPFDANTQRQAYTAQLNAAECQTTPDALERLLFQATNFRFGSWQLTTKKGHGCWLTKLSVTAIPGIRSPNHHSPEPDGYLFFENWMVRYQLNSLAFRGTLLEELIPSHRG